MGNPGVSGTVVSSRWEIQMPVDTVALPHLAASGGQVVVLSSTVSKARISCLGLKAVLTADIREEIIDTEEMHIDIHHKKYWFF